jgi:hypothetical protein
MTQDSDINLEEAAEFARAANRLRDSGALEEPLKLNLFHHLPLIFSGRPNWIAHHISGAESMVRIGTETGIAGRFPDSLVGYTTIEYEANLRSGPRFKTGLKQVREHCAGLLNGGAPIDKVIGILSDTVLWQAYTVSLEDGAEVGLLGPDDVELTLVGSTEVSDDSEPIARDLADFLQKHLARRGSRPLTADNISRDLGFDSPAGGEHVNAVGTAVTEAFELRAAYGALIEELWARFVAVAGESPTDPGFDREEYSSELYLVTVAKLICANVLSRRPIRSDEAELRSILSGAYFESLGLDNVVEYDYFGWLSEPPHVDLILPIAGRAQEDLHAYDFETLPAEDIFGQLIAVLGEKSHRLLLGQEFTPAWLCGLMADKTLDMLAPGEPPRAVDMCCGSGAMLVALSGRYRERLSEAGYEPGDSEALRLLVESTTGFDVDPLAVLLAKVNWLMANRDWLVRGERVSVPVYHADSLFVGVPFSEDGGESGSYRLTLYEDVGLDLPAFLIGPESRSLFDDLLHRAYRLTRAVNGAQLEQEAIDAAVEGAIAENRELADHESAMLIPFFSELVGSLLALQEAGLNGLWAFVLRNCYRPSLVAGQFNALISNPPWLALSKIAGNPYGDSLRSLASELGLSPPGAAHLHTELATTFLYASVDRFLEKDSGVVCVLPDPVLNGYQHTPFRTGAPSRSPRRVPLEVLELWRVEHGTFKNEAIVLAGRVKSSHSSEIIPGSLALPSGLSDNPFHVVSRGNRTVWTDLPPASHPTGFFDAGDFRQGADLMPRTVLFHSLSRTTASRFDVGPIDRNSSPLRYLVKSAKRFKDFSVESGSVAGRYIYNTMLSNHLTPFDLAPPAAAVLPFTRTANGWEAPSQQVLAVDRSSAQVISAMLGELGFTESSELLESVETPRRKLSSQQFIAGKYLVVYGAGGGVVCAAYRLLEEDDEARLVVDQTLYWHVVESEEEALYLAGMFNSPALGPVIAAFQPKGQQGERHIHRLPVLVTPRFDAADPAHLAVVEVTRTLLQQWRHALGSEAELKERLDPCRALASRRTALRRAVEALPAASDWSEATTGVFEGQEPQN